MRKYGVAILQYCILTWLISLLLFGFEFVISRDGISFKYLINPKQAKEKLLEIRELKREIKERKERLHELGELEKK